LIAHGILLKDTKTSKFGEAASVAIGLYDACLDVYDNYSYLTIQVVANKNNNNYHL
jgi:hypothetical protein